MHLSTTKAWSWTSRPTELHALALAKVGEAEFLRICREQEEAETRSLAVLQFRLSNKMSTAGDLSSTSV